MSTPFIGEIRVVSFNFAPKGWALCNGQLLAINQNQALFSILGTTYGGNGTTNFALPNLQGRASIHQGQGAGLSSFVLGETGGEETHTLTPPEMPEHTHLLNAAADAVTAVPSTSVVLGSPSALTPAYGGATALTALSSASIAPSGGSQPHENLQPYLVVNYVIALQGIFPSRN